MCLPRGSITVDSNEIQRTRTNYNLEDRPFEQFRRHLPLPYLRIKIQATGGPFI